MLNLCQDLSMLRNIDIGNHEKEGHTIGRHVKVSIYFVARLSFKNIMFSSIKYNIWLIFAQKFI